MVRIREIKNKVFLFINDKKKFIGKLEKTKKGNVFRCSRSYERHLYRKLNSFNICAKILTLNIDYIIFDLVAEGNLEKHYGIEIDKLKKLRMDFNCDVNYHNYERQIAIPLAIMDFKLGNSIKKGVSVEKFGNKINNTRSAYYNWNTRKPEPYYDKHNFNELKDL